MTTLRHPLLTTLFMALVALAPAWPAGAEAPSKGYVVAVNNAPPYRIVDPENPASSSGIYIDIAREMANRAGIRLIFKPVTFARALDMMETGESDIMLGPNRTPERERYMAYLDAPLPKEAKAFYVRKGARPVTSYNSLSGRTIAMLKGAKYFVRLDRDTMLKKLQLNSYDQAIEMLLAGMADVVVMPEQLGDYLTRDMTERVEKGYYLREGKLSYLALSKKSPLMKKRAKLTAILKKMVEDNTYIRTIQHYRD